MKVYLLIETYYNGVDAWDKVFGVYADSEAANIEAARLNKEASLTNSEWQQTFWTVNEETLIK